MFDYMKLLKKYNRVQGELEVLKETVKDELYKKWMDKLGEPLEMERLRKENKDLRKKIKVLKEIIKEGDKKK
jgi:hypothetical protein